LDSAKAGTRSVAAMAGRVFTQKLTYSNTQSIDHG